MNTTTALSEEQLSFKEGSEDAILEALGGSSSIAASAAKKALTDPSSHYSPGTTSSVEEKALQLLGNGVPSESVASALGVTPARISQLLADEHFAQKVAALRYETLQKHNARDSRYDSIEDKLLEKLDKSLPLMVKPETIMKAINIVNGAKRRGSSAPQQTVNQQNVVNLILPQTIAQKFSVNINNQVTKAGDQSLLTMPSGNLLKQVEQATASRLEAPNSEDTSEY